MAINIGAMFAPSAATAITNVFLGKAGLIYKADIPALSHQVLNGTITEANAAKFADLQGKIKKSLDIAAECDELAIKYNALLKSVSAVREEKDEQPTF